MANEGSRTSGIFSADTLLDIGTNIVGEFFGGFARDVAKWGLDKWRDHKANKKYREHLVTLCGDADLDEGDLKDLLEEAKAYYEGNEQKRGSVRDLIMDTRGINFEAYLEPLGSYRALPEEKQKAVVSVLTGARTAIYDWEWSRLDKETREQQSILIDGIRSMMQALIMPHVENHEYTLEAALTCNKELVYKAFLNDPQVKGRAGEADVKKLVDDMIANTLTYLPEGWK